MNFHSNIYALNDSKVLHYQGKTIDNKLLFLDCHTLENVIYEDRKVMIDQGFIPISSNEPKEVFKNLELFFIQQSYEVIRIQYQMKYNDLENDVCFDHLNKVENYIYFWRQGVCSLDLTAGNYSDIKNFEKIQNNIKYKIL